MASKKAFQCRLPPDILALVDEQVKQGKATSRSDLIFRALFQYFLQDSYMSGATEKFREMFYSKEFGEYVKSIVRDENNRILDKNTDK